MLKDVTKQELLEVCMFALAEAESWIEDQLQGTNQYQEALDDLKPVRDVINRAIGASND